MSRILVLDDEPQMRKVLQETLRRSGHQVSPAGTAAECLELVYKEPFDLVLVDIGLPDGSGISVLRRIREASRDLPVVIYSGLLTADTELEAKAAGATDVLSKDVGIAQITAQIGRILGSGGPEADEGAVLIVDDEEPVRRMLMAYFAGKGRRAVEADSGEKALEIAAAGGISVVLLDIRMPGMDGMAALKALLRADPRLGVVMTTGLMDQEKVKEALEAGASGYVLKPFDFLYLDLVVASRLKFARRA